MVKIATGAEKSGMRTKAAAVFRAREPELLLRDEPATRAYAEGPADVIGALRPTWKHR